MRRFWPRLLKSVLPVTLLCGAAGYLYALAAGSYVADQRDDGSTLRDTLVWRVPFTMAAWGGGITLLVEWFRHLWGANKTDAAAAATAAPQQTAEQILMQLLEQAEQAEESRKFPVPPPPSVNDTPLPDFPLPTFPPAPAPDHLPAVMR